MLHNQDANEERNSLFMPNIQDAGQECAALASEGGPAIRTQPWPTYDKGDLLLIKEDTDAAVRAIRSQRLFRYDTRSYGETEVGRFEQEVTRYFGAPHALAVSSGTAAITVALLSAGIKAGDKVACSAFTFSATPSAIRLAGGIPVIVDTDDDLHFDVADLERRWDPDMKAVVVVHMRGFASDMEPIKAFTEPRNVVLIEDAVPSCGVTLRGKHLGTFGYGGAFSTQSDKSINTGEGGFLLLKDEAALARAAVFSGAYEGRVFHHVTQENFDDCALPLYNFRLDEVRGAMARSQLNRLKEKVRRHRAIYDEVVTGMAKIDLLYVRQPVVPGDGYLGHCINFWVRGATIEQTRWFTQALRAEGIDVRQFGDPQDENIRCFWNWRFLWPGESRAQIKSRAPNAARLLETCLDVPLSAGLTHQDRRDFLLALDKISAAYIHRFGGVV